MKIRVKFDKKWIFCHEDGIYIYENLWRSTKVLKSYKFNMNVVVPFRLNYTQGIEYLLDKAYGYQNT